MRVCIGDKVFYDGILEVGVQDVNCIGMHALVAMPNTFGIAWEPF